MKKHRIQLESGEAPPAKRVSRPKATDIFSQVEALNAAFLGSASHSEVSRELHKFQSARKASPATAGPSPQATTLSQLRVDAQELSRRAERRHRFLAEQAGAPTFFKPKDRPLAELRAEGAALHGQNESLEKEYLRLTSLPTAAEVRPPEVLRRALDAIKAKWKEASPLICAPHQ
jgi:hypothetical protein